jgi:hypothetical protein
MKRTRFPLLWSILCLLPALVAAVRPAYAQMEACRHPLETAADCGLKGPVRTAESWGSFPDAKRERQNANKVEPPHNFLSFSPEGVVTGGGVDNNGDRKVDWRYVRDESQRSVTLDQTAADNPQQADFHAERVFFYDPQGHLILIEDAAPDGTLQDVERFLYDGAGDELWEEDYAEGRRYDRIDYTYDDLGRLIREAHLNRGYMEYEYPSPGRTVAVYFPAGGEDDQQSPAIKSSLTIETTLDDAGRPLDEVTKGAPLEYRKDQPWPYEYLTSGGYKSRVSGRVIKTYNDQGRILTQTNYTPSGKRDFVEIHEYDKDGNILSQTMGGDDFVETHRFQFGYQFDAQGNWIQKSQYAVGSDGTREIIEIDYRKLAYY